MEPLNPKHIALLLEGIAKRGWPVTSTELDARLQSMTGEPDPETLSRIVVIVVKWALEVYSHDEAVEYLRIARGLAEGYSVAKIEATLAPAR